MVKKLLPALSVIIFLSSCSTFKPLNFTSNKQIATVQSTAPATKFIEEISVIPQAESDNTIANNEPEVKPIAKSPSRSTKQSSSKTSKSIEPVSVPSKLDEVKLFERIFAEMPAEVESASPVQLKYAILMDTEVESLPSKVILEAVDEWYGVRYRTGGNTTNGVDCSGFTVGVYAALFGMQIPKSIQRTI